MKKENDLQMHERKKVNKGKMLVICFLLMAVCIFLDQFSKYLALTNLRDNDSFVLIDGVLELYYIVNTGSSWGMLAGQKALILFISVVIILLELIISFKTFPAPTDGN